MYLFSHFQRMCVLLSFFTITSCYAITAIEQLENTISSDQHNQDIIQALAYNPQIRIENMHANICPTICIHGFGDSAHSFTHGITFPLNLKSAIHFDLPDAEIHTNFSFKILRKTSFGQISEVLPFLYILKLCHEAGFRAVNIYGMSRGAAVAVNALAILNNNSYQRQLRKIGIQNGERQAIISMLRNGTVCIDAPLAHVKYVLHNMVENFRNNLLKKFFNTNTAFNSSINQPANNPSFAKRILYRLANITGKITDFIGSKILQYCVLPIITSYKPWREETIHSAKKLNNLNIPILLHLEENDVNVTNKGDNVLHQRLYNHNPHHTYFHKSNDGGHLAYRQELPRILKAFQKRYTGAPSTKYTSVLANSRPSPANIC